jgi:hypothetical protein
LPMVAQPLLLGTDGPLPLLQDLLVLCMLLIRPPLPPAVSIPFAPESRLLL